MLVDPLGLCTFCDWLVDRGKAAYGAGKDLVTGKTIKEFASTLMDAYEEAGGGLKGIGMAISTGAYAVTSPFFACYDAATRAGDPGDVSSNCAQAALMVIGPKAVKSKLGRAKGGQCRKTTTVAPKKGTKIIRNPGGRHGGPAHREVISDVEKRLRDKGWKTISGGSLPERKHGSRYPDLVLEKDGKTIALQIGRVTKSGIPVAREKRALADLRATGDFDHVFYIGFTS